MPIVLAATWWPDNTLDLFVEHHGIDWLAFVLMFLSLYRLGNHKRDGFLYGAGAAAAWTAFNLNIVSLAGVIANVIFIGMNIRGYIGWHKRNPPAGEDPQESAGSPAKPTPEPDSM